MSLTSVASAIKLLIERNRVVAEGAAPHLLLRHFPEKQALEKLLCRFGWKY